MIRDIAGGLTPFEFSNKVMFNESSVVKTMDDFMRFINTIYVRSSGITDIEILSLLVENSSILSLPYRITTDDEGNLISIKIVSVNGVLELPIVDYDISNYKIDDVVHMTICYNYLLDLVGYDEKLLELVAIVDKRLMHTIDAPEAVKANIVGSSHLIWIDNKDNSIVVKFKGELFNINLLSRDIDYLHLTTAEKYEVYQRINNEKN